MSRIRRLEPSSSLIMNIETNFLIHFFISLIISAFSKHSKRPFIFHNLIICHLFILNPQGNVEQYSKQDFMYNVQRIISNYLQMTGMKYN